MARLLNTVAGRLTLVALLMHAVLLPVLLNAVLLVVRDSNVDIFVSQVRIYGRFMADVIAASGAIDDDARLVEVLDNAVLSGDGVYAELREAERSVLSSVVVPGSALAFREDFAFGEHGDRVYYMSLPLQVPGHEAMLRLGFNEQPTLDAIAMARSRILWILGGYLATVLTIVVVLSFYLTRPLRELRRASQSIASGRYAEQLTVRSGMLEVSQLARDLELMRSKLVGVNERLQGEILERKAVEEQRETLAAQLRHTQKIETVGTLAGGIAHEFNNILVPITLYGEMVLDEAGAGSRTGHYAAQVLKAANRAKGLVRQILAFSHQGDRTARRPVQVGPIAQEAVQLLRALLPASVDIRPEIDMQAGPVMADSAEIYQLVMNLCNNAYQALDPEGGLIRVEVAALSVGPELANQHPDLHVGPYVVLSVADDGHGIDPVTRQRIFEPFFTTRGVGAGTGLGLAVAHGIAARHAGTILVESELGHGSRFLVYLPAFTGTLTLEPSPRARILYVSADAVTAEEHAAQLRAGGHDVNLLAGTPEPAALPGGDAGWDVVIADRETLEVTADWVQSLGNRPRLVVLSALGDIISSAEQEQYGVSVCLVEPVDSSTLAACIAELLVREDSHA